MWLSSINEMVCLGRAKEKLVAGKLFGKWSDKLKTLGCDNLLLF